MFSQEEKMRKLYLSLAAAAIVLSTGAFTADSNAMTVGGLRPAINHAGIVSKAGLVCGHFWNGRYHRFSRCHGERGFGYRHFRHGHYRHWR
jgi:hypothetical protein